MSSVQLSTCPVFIKLHQVGAEFEEQLPLKKLSHPLR